jgi:hypothetical protein
MVWLYRSIIPMGRRGVISSFKWFLPTFPARRGRGGGVGTLWVCPRLSSLKPQVVVAGVVNAGTAWGIDTGGKITAGIVGTGGQFISGVNEIDAHTFPRFSLWKSYLLQHQNINLIHLGKKKTQYTLVSRQSSIVRTWLPHIICRLRFSSRLKTINLSKRSNLRDTGGEFAMHQCQEQRYSIREHYASCTVICHRCCLHRCGG